MFLNTPRNRLDDNSENMLLVNMFEKNIYHITRNLEHGQKQLSFPEMMFHHKLLWKNTIRESEILPIIYIYECLGVEAI